MNPSERQAWRAYLKACEKASFTLRTVRAYLVEQKGYAAAEVDAAILDYRALRHKRVAYAGLFMLFIGMFAWLLILNFTERGTTGYAVSGGVPTVTVDVTQSIGVVSDTFYGVNTHGVWGSNNSRIDCNNDGAEDCMSDYQWHRTKLLSAGTGYIRSDMALSDIATGVNTFKNGLSNYGSMATRKNTLQWAAQNNIKVLFTAYSMPSWLADNQSYCANDHTNCPPSNYATWGQLLVNYLNAVGCSQYPGTCEVDVWNEPDLQQFWLPNIASTDPQRAALYNQLYTASYNAIKAWNPSIPVGGPAVSTLQDPGGKMVYRSFLGNFSGRANFFTFHEYYFDTYDTGDYDGHLRTRIMPQLLADCARYNFDCSRIVLGEYNTYNYSEQLSNPTGQAKQLALAYSYMLNNFPDGMDMVVYQWAEGTNYSNGARYPEYPRRMSMVAEPRLENTLYAPYTVMESFSRYHAAGSIVVSSNSTNANIVTVASTSGTDTYVTVVNRASIAQAVTLGVSGMAASALDDVSSTALFPVLNGIADLGTLAPGAIRHYRIIRAAPNVPPNNPVATLRSVDNSNMTTGDLQCAATLRDNDSVALNATVTWYRNGVLHTTAQYAGFGNNTLATGLLDSGLLSVAELWSCRVRANDGLNSSGWGISNTLLVLSLPLPPPPPPPNATNTTNSTNATNSTLPNNATNSTNSTLPPPLGNVTNSTNSTNSTLPTNGTNSTNSTLPPPVINGTNATNMTNSTNSTLPPPPGNLSNTSNASNSSGTVLTSPRFSPLINNASSLTRRYGTVRWNVGVTDSSGVHSVSFTSNSGSSWTTTTTGGTQNNTSVSVNAIVTVSQAAGDVVCGQFSAMNLQNQTNLSDQSCFFVADTEPVLNGIELVSESNTTVDPLSCFVTATDVDGDVINTTVTWYLNGIGIGTARGTAPSGAELEFTLPASFLTAGESWACGAIATDGTLESDVLLSGSITVSAPATSGGNSTNPTNSTNSTLPTNGTNGTNSTLPTGGNGTNATNSSSGSGSTAGSGKSNSGGGGGGGGGVPGGVLSTRSSQGTSGATPSTPVPQTSVEVTTASDNGPAQNVGGESIAVTEEQLATPTSPDEEAPVTVRSSALSYVALLIVGAGMLLTAWLWYRNRITEPVTAPPQGLQPLP